MVKKQNKTNTPTYLTLTGARFRNLKNIGIRLPLARLIVVAGPSGAGKSTLFRNLLVPAAAHASKTNTAKLTGKKFLTQTDFTPDDLPPPPAAQPPHPGAKRPLPATRHSLPATSTTASLSPFTELTNANRFKTIIEVDQTPIGKTLRSTPATYLGIFDTIRQFFATLPEAKIRGYTPGRFSFNTTGGRCETCQGAGRVKLEMAFMPEHYVVCDNCNGLRYAPELNDITWKGKSIGQVLQMEFAEAVRFFDFHSHIREVCQLMNDCGLGYLTLGQSSPTLSGGEAQRLKLVTELARGLPSHTARKRGEIPQNLYLLEEPTIGLHLSDIVRLIQLLQNLVDQGHTVIVIEHHMDIIAEADYLVELGPVGGPEGGHLIHQGPISELLKNKNSPTAPYLKKHLAASATPKAPKA